MQRLTFSFTPLIPFLLVGAASISVACGTDTTRQPREGEFISYVPGEYGDQNLNGATEDAASGAGGSTGDAGDGDGNDDGDSAERAIAEADIIQVKDHLLFALSRYSGLSIVNVADPNNLRLVGGYRSSATPFEMYLEEDTAYVMYNGWYSVVFDEAVDSYVWQSTSRMQAIDISTPSEPKLVGDLEVPGSIIDSRKVGDVIYLATHQDGYCWDCESTANVQVTSFNVKNAAKFTPIDRLVFQNNDDSWTRSISVSQERIYVSGWSWNEQVGSIDVVDISDPNGELAPGATLSIAGQIESRWQMDEYDGTLRVISQPGGWGTTNPPVLETFEVTSSHEIQKLASLDLVLPRPEDLRSVRFDGERAFAITFERTDPLFTFDLSDAASPKQVGELEIPGWVYHMEPRGDRVYALGFEDGASAGALHVSLFDVSDLANPQQIDRVNFGGSWANFAEDQDRIHKAFNIMSEEGLILVPFSGYSYEEDSCTSSYQSGIQLVDMTEDSLTLRGVAPQIGEARRALMLGDTLLGVTDNAIQAFDIENRDKPTELDQLEVARNISSIRVMGDSMLRFGSDWWSGRTQLDFASLDRVESAEPLGEIDLAALVGSSEEMCRKEGDNYFYSYANWGGEVFVHGDYAYVPRYRETSGESENDWSWERQLTLFIVNISDQNAPRLVGTFELDPTNDKNNESYAGIVQTKSALLVGRQGYTDLAGGLITRRTFSYDVIDLSGGEKLSISKRMPLPDTYANGGWGYGVGGCMIDMDWGWWGGGYGTPSALVSGDIVVSQHEEPLNDGTGRVRYYMDRLDVSDAENPRLLAQVNIPGKVVHFDASAQRAITIDHLLETKPAKRYSDCYENGSSYYSQFDEENNRCLSYRRRLNVLSLNGDTAILTDSKDIDGEIPARSIAVSDNRVFYNTVAWEENGPGQHMVQTLAITGPGKLSRLPAVDIAGANSWWGNLVARDGRAFLTQENELTVIDASGSTPTLKTHEMGGWWCGSLEVHEDVAYCAMGEYGVRAFPLKK